MFRVHMLHRLAHICCQEHLPGLHSSASSLAEAPSVPMRPGLCDPAQEEGLLLSRGASEKCRRSAVPL